MTPADEGDASVAAPDEPARTPDGDRVAFDPVDRPPPGELALTARKFLLLVAIAIGLALLWVLRDLLIVLLIAILVASGMHGVVRPLERRLPRLAAIGVAYGALILVLAGLGLIIAPPLVDEATNLVEDLPSIVDELRGDVIGLVDAVAGSGAGERMFDQLVPPPVGDGEADGEGLITIPFTILEVLVNVVIVMFVSAFVLLERDAIVRWTSRFLLARDRRPALDLARTAATKLGAYVRGQLLIMVVTGVGVAAGMMLLGVPFALPMGVLGFLAEAIPLAGPFIVGIPVVLLAFLEGPVIGLLMLGWFLLLQQAEGWLIYPVVQGRILSLSPLVVVLAVLTGANLYGVMGALIAVPIVAIVDVVLREIVFPLRRRASRRDIRAARRADGSA